MDENKIYEEELVKTQKLISDNQNLLELNMGFLASTVINIIHLLTTIELNIESIFKLYNSSNYKDNKKAVSEILKEIEDKKYIYPKKRNKLLNKIAQELKIKNFDVATLKNLSDERDKLGHFQLRLEIGGDNIPVIGMYSRKEGKVDADSVYADFMKYYKKAQKELDPIFLKFGIEPIYWRGK